MANKTKRPKAKATESAKAIESAKATESNSEPLVLKYTAKEEIPKIVSRLTKSFHATGKTHSLQYRLNQLRNLYFAISNNKERICDALYEDFNRSPAETMNLECSTIMGHLIHTMANLHKWAAPEKVQDIPVIMKMTPVYVEHIPLGVVLVISPFNYPLILAIGSIAGAIAGGNCVVLKPSELTPHFSQLLAEILTDAMDPETFAVVNGAVEETTLLLDQKFDKIMYTGSTAVGTIIAKKAAETLTPVLLELGGKSPPFVLGDVKDSDIKTIAKRIVWGRYTNSGQTCVAVDYIVVHESVKDKLVNAIAEVINEEFYKDLTSSSNDYTHIINKKAFHSIKKMIDDTKGNVVVGGDADEATCFIPPTLIDDVSWEDSTMRQEIFGPVLPVIIYLDLEDAVRHVVNRHDTPLTLFIFTSGHLLRAKNPQVDLIRTAIRSGATVLNDSFLHVGLLNAPFGGIGQSGHGSYHGFYSFRAFTHERTILESRMKTEKFMSVRYPPFNDKKNAIFGASQQSYNGAIWFSRTGDVSVGGPSTLWSWWHTAAGLASLVFKSLGGM